MTIQILITILLGILCSITFASATSSILLPALAWVTVMRFAPIKLGKSN